MKNIKFYYFLFIVVLTAACSTEAINESSPEEVLNERFIAEEGYPRSSTSKRGILRRSKNSGGIS